MIIDPWQHWTILCGAVLLVLLAVFFAWLFRSAPVDVLYKSDDADNTIIEIRARSVRDAMAILDMLASGQGSVAGTDDNSR